jgi:C-terminal processing protease CtpA/Prc
LTLEEKFKKLKKRFRILLTAFLLFAALMGTYIYLNYDYLAFKHFTVSFYSYTGSLDQVFQKELKRDVQGNYYKYFDDLAISVVTKRIREENNDRYTYLYTPEQYMKYNQEEKTEALQSEIKELNNSTVYMRLTNFSKFTQKFLENNYDKLKPYPNLVIDLRENRGGDIDAMAAMSGMFLKKGSLIATDKLRFFDKTYKAGGGKKFTFDKLLILQDKNSASASENMIAALRDNLPNVTLIGSTTFGKGIGQFTLPLKGGFAVKETILLWNTPRGINIHGKGIAPDIAYDESAAGADIIEYALKLLAENKQLR